MAKTAVQQWDTNPNNNADINGIGIAQGWFFTDQGGAFRTMMAQIATWAASVVTWALGNASTIQDTGTTPTARGLGYRDVPMIGPVTSATTIALANIGSGLQVGTGGSVVVPANASVAFLTGAVVPILNRTNGFVNVTGASGVTIRLAGTSTTGNRTLAAYGMATLIKVDTDEWWFGGQGAA